MKAKQKTHLPFGDLVVATYAVWGSGLAEKMMRWAIKQKFVTFDGHTHSLRTSSKVNSA